MTFTGLWYSFDLYKDGVVRLLSRPDVAAAKMEPKQPRPPGRPEPAQPVGFDRAWSTLQHEESAGFARAQLTLPAGPGTAMRIRSWPKDSTLELIAMSSASMLSPARPSRRSAMPTRRWARRRLRACSTSTVARAGLAGQARVHDRRGADAAVCDHRRAFVLVAPQVAASGQLPLVGLFPASEWDAKASQDRGNRSKAHGLSPPGFTP